MTRDIQGKIAYLIFIFTMLCIPLFMEHGYFDVNHAKAHIFWIGSALIGCSILISCIAEKNLSSLLPHRNSVMEIVLFATALCALISSLFSASLLNSFLGTNGWFIGSLAWCMFYLFYQFQVKHLKYRPNLWLPVLVVNAVVFIIGILNAMHIDPFFMHKGILPEQFYWYISTIGNSSWYAGYLCLIVPLFTVFYLASEQTFSRRLFLCVVSLGIANIILCVSDGLYLGLAICTLFMIPFMCDKRERIQRIGILLLISAALMFIILHLPAFAVKRDSMGGLTLAMLDDKLITAIAIVALLLVILFKRISNWTKRAAKILTIAFEVLAGVSIVAGIIMVSSGFSDSWGTGRGEIWRLSFKAFNNFTPLHKMIGAGPEMLKTYYTGISDQFTMRVLVAHSEPLQILLSMGLLGILLIGVLEIFLIRLYIKDRLWKTQSIAFFVPLAAYAGQALVNSAQLTNFFVLCTLLACLTINHSKVREEVRV